MTELKIVLKVILMLTAVVTLSSCATKHASSKSTDHTKVEQEEYDNFRRADEHNLIRNFRW